MSKVQRRLIQTIVAVTLVGGLGFGAHVLIRTIIAMHS